MITVVDYGLGNVRAFINAFKLMNVEATAAKNGDELRGATKVVLPGVGAFDHAMELLGTSGMRGTLDDLVLKQRVPVLGVCVGMQILGTASDEGKRPGLGWIDGRVRRLDALDARGDLRMPHMGWNDVTPTENSPLFAAFDESPRFYFLHSYYFECARPNDIAARSTYGAEFSCAVRADNIYGVQFHPEKSHHFGTRLLKNFAEL
jgi:glutamine amidotransferase